MPYKKLIAGFHIFKKNYFQSKDKELYQNLVDHGQKPETLIIACSDSRIDPAILTHSTPGDFFAIRNVAALVPPCNNTGILHGTSSAIEYAVRQLKVGHIVILGHAGCGGVNALATENYKAIDNNDFQFLHHWLGIAATAKEKVYNVLGEADDSTKTKALEQASILVSMENLLSFPWIKDKYTAKEVQIHGWYFDMKKGDLLEYNPATFRFEEARQHDSTEALLEEGLNIDSFLKNYPRASS